jgi:iron complex outermembrane receptor protein
MERWRISAAYTLLRMSLEEIKKNSYTDYAKLIEGDSPDQQASLRSSVDRFMDLELDMCLRYVDSLVSQEVGSYLTLDVRLGWQPVKALEFAVVGQNLPDNQRPEFAPVLYTDLIPTEVERSVYGKITWRF